MTANICFNHKTPLSDTANEDLKLAYDADGKIAVGLPGASVSITLHDSGSGGRAMVHLYWCEPNLGTPAAFRRSIDAELIPFPANPDVLPGQDVTTNVTWSASVNSLGALSSAHGCLFARMEVEPETDVYSNASAPSNWDPHYVLNAQLNMHLVIAHQGTPAVRFAFGAGHTQKSAFTTRVRMDYDAQCPGRLAPQIVAHLGATTFANVSIPIGTCTEAPDAMLIEGAECVVAPRILPDGTPPIRLGNTGVISDTMLADDLAINEPARSHSLTLLPDMLRQVIVDIPITPYAQPNDLVYATVIHETRWRYVRTPPVILGSSIVVVRIVP